MTPQARQPARSGIGGKLIALAVVIALAGIFGWSYLQSSQQGGAGSGGANAAGTDQRSGARSGGRSGGPDPEAVVDDLLGTREIAGAAEARWISVDQDTNETRYILTAAALDPAGSGRFRAVEPNMRIFADDARILVTAEQGELLRPIAGEDPESGTLRGDVVVRVLEPNAPGVDIANLDDSELDETLRFETDEITFQTVLGQAETDAPVRVSAPGVTFEGVGLTVRVSEVQRRLQYLRIARHEKTTLVPSELRENERRSDGEREPGQDRRSARTPSDDRDAESAETPAARIDAYRLTLGGGVQLAQGPRRIEADELDIWARLRDGRLAPDAIGDLNRPNEDAGPSASSTPTGGPSNTADERTPAFDPDQPVVLTSGGSLEITPLDADPAELAQDEVALRLRSLESGRVLIADEHRGLRARAGSIAWGLTQQRIEARGVGGELGVEIELAERGRLLTGAADVDLLAGTALFPGAGTAEVVAAAAAGQAGADATLPSADEPARLAWSERATARVVRTAAGGDDWALRQLTATGDVTGEAAGVELDAAFARADFAPPRAGGGPQLATIVTERGDRPVRITFTDDRGRPGEIVASTLRVLFAPSAAEPSRVVPTAATAEGDAAQAGEREAVRAVVTLAGERLEAERLTAELTERDGEPEIATLDARGRVRARTADGVELAGDRAQAFALETPGSRTLDLTGSPAMLAAFEPGGRTFAGGGVVLGDVVRIDEAARTLVVEGPGSASYAVPRTEAGGAGAERVNLAWTTGMSFNDAAGELVAQGRVLAEAQPNAGELYRAQGDRLDLALTPELLSEATRDRLRAEDGTPVREAVLTGAAGVPAEAERRAYAEGGTDDLLTLASMRAGRIVADQRAQRVDAPGAGMLVLEDRRPAGDADDSRLRGTSVFEWNGAFAADGVANRISMDGGVRLRHLGTGEDGGRVLTTIEAARALASVVPRERPAALPGETAGEADPASGALVLRRVLLEGDVSARRRGDRLRADTVELLAAVERLIARADPGRRVSLFERDRRRTVDAEQMTIDLATGEWEAEGASVSASP